MRNQVTKEEGSSAILYPLIKRIMPHMTPEVWVFIHMNSDKVVNVCMIVLTAQRDKLKFVDGMTALDVGKMLDVEFSEFYDEFAEQTIEALKSQGVIKQD